MALSNKVCVVTGATRGIGKGIALQLGEKGAKVYITGRTLDPPQKSEVGGSLRDTTLEIEARGGTCIPVQCDHTNDKDIERLFEQVKQENSGRLDVLVNNAFSVVNELFSNLGVGFWEQPMSMWDDVNNVGLRNHYICSIYAARLLVPRKKGLIVNISSVGGLRYLFNVPYGVGKQACDRMTTDCALELRKHNVAFVSLWPGAVGTEKVLTYLDDQLSDTKQELLGVPFDLNEFEKLQNMYKKGETTEFVGRCIVKLACDPEIMKKSGKILMTCDLAREYGLQDEPGHTPTEMRQVNGLLKQSGYHKTAMLVPNFVRIPHWFLSLSKNKL